MRSNGSQPYNNARLALLLQIDDAEAQTLHIHLASYLKIACLDPDHMKRRWHVDQTDIHAASDPNELPPPLRVTIAILLELVWSGQLRATPDDDDDPHDPAAYIV